MCKLLKRDLLPCAGYIYLRGFEEAVQNTLQGVYENAKHYYRFTASTINLKLLNYDQRF